MIVSVSETQTEAETMSGYHLVRDGKLIGTAETFEESCRMAAEASKIDRGVTFKGQKGCIVSIWSGPFQPTYPNGTAKHARYTCGVLS